MQDKERYFLVTVNNAKNHSQRSFPIIPSEVCINGVELIRKYISLKPAKCKRKDFFLFYNKISGKCANQVVARNTLATYPNQIAAFLKLEHPEQYTGDSFRRTSARILADTGANM